MILKLKVFLVKNNLTCSDFGELLDIHKQYASAIVSGRIKPSKKLARNIEKMTNGEVTAQDLLSPLEPYKNKRSKTC